MKSLSIRINHYKMNKNKKIAYHWCNTKIFVKIQEGCDNFWNQIQTNCLNRRLQVKNEIKIRILKKKGLK
jgi:hypothetical protein